MNVIKNGIVLPFIMSEYKLELLIRNEKPVELSRLVLSLNCVAHEYEIFCKKKYAKDNVKHALLINEVKQGSIIVDLVSSVIPLIDDVNSVCAFATYLKLVFDVMLNKCTDTINLTKKECKNIKGMMETTANDSDKANISITVKGNNNTVYAPIFICQV